MDCQLLENLLDWNGFQDDSDWAFWTGFTYVWPNSGMHIMGFIVNMCYWSMQTFRVNAKMIGHLGLKVYEFRVNAKVSGQLEFWVLGPMPKWLCS